jgi:prolipoprotein diacylglyceryltransferase
MILYGIERGTIEFFRGDPGRTLLFHDRISLMQVASIIFIITGSFLWWRGLRSPAASPLQTAAS